VGEEPDKKIIFVVMHEGGSIIYTYPPLREEQYILSPLVSAVFAILEHISETENEMMSVSTKDREMFALKRGEIIYALFVSKDLKQYGGELLASLIEIINQDFPAEIIDGIVKVREDTSSLTSSIERFLKERLEKILARKEKPLPLSDALRMLGIEKATKFYRGLIAKKHLVVYGYNSDLIRRIVRTLLLCCPFSLPVSTSPREIPKDTQIILAINKDQAEQLKDRLIDAVFINFDEPLKEKIKKDYLLECIKQVLKLESDESRVMKLKEDILSLSAIVADIEKIIGREKEVSIEKLRRELQQKHPAEKVAYVLEVLASEKSRIMEKIRTPDKTLEEIFF